MFIFQIYSFRAYTYKLPLHAFPGNDVFQVINGVTLAQRTKLGETLPSLFPQGGSLARFVLIPGILQQGVGRRIKKYREAAGLTQETFSELIGLGVKHVSSIECGAVGVSLSTLKQVSTVISIPADVLLFGEADEIEQQYRTSELQLLFVRLSRLPSNKFNVVKDVVDRLLKAFAME